jgi:hypothetical protein
MLPKMENDVNASLRVLVKRLCADVRVTTRLQGATPPRTSGASPEISGYEARYIECNNLLARGVSCGRLPSFAAPLL